MRDEMVCLTLQWGMLSHEYIDGEEDICLPLKKARDIIIADEDDLYIAYGYKVTPDIAEKLKLYYRHQFNFKKYDYFVCSHSDYECVDGKPVHTRLK